MEIFHQSFHCILLNLPDLIEFILLLQSMYQFLQLFKIKVIDRYMHCIMQNLKINAQVCTLYSLADLNVRHYVELAFHGGKLSRLFTLTFLK